MRTSLILLLVIAGCSPSPEQARKTLEAKNIPVTNEVLLQKTKQLETDATATLLVTAGTDPNARQPNGMTALMSAALHRQVDTVSALVERGADVNATAGDYSVLLAAVYGGEPKIVKRLLERGADPNYSNAEGKTALRAAREGKREEIVALLEKAGARK